MAVVVVLITSLVVVMEVLHPLVTIVHQVVDRVLTGTNNMKEHWAVTQTKVQLESMVVPHRHTETHQV